jgi:thioredoxin-dependent peroxiredoxin
MLAIGSQAPDFEGEATTGARVALRDKRGKWVVLFFFPKAFTAG